MPRENAMATPEAIRIEDEVWQEAFTRREPARPSRERRLQAIKGELPDWLIETTGKTPPFEYVGAVAAATGVIADEAPAAPRPVADDPPAAVPSPALVGVGAGRAAATPARRTVKIQGRGAERNLPLPDSSRRRPPRRAYERTGFRPDRLAMWAVMLGFVLVLIAILSAH
jgi:hypothetical protein